MEAYPFASDAKVAATSALIGQPIGQQEVQLLRQIVLAMSLRAGQTPEAALGGTPIAQTEVLLLQQLLVLVATT